MGEELWRHWFLFLFIFQLVSDPIKNVVSDYGLIKTQLLFYQVDIPVEFRMVWNLGKLLKSFQIKANAFLAIETYSWYVAWAKKIITP